MAISKTRMRMEQIKGGKLELKHNDATALEIVALEDVGGTPGDALYIKVDATNDSEKVILGSADADRPTKIQMDGEILNGSAVVYESEGIGNNDVDTKIPTAAAVKDYVDLNGASFVIEDEDGTEVTISNNKEMKFQGGPGITINWTDVSTGSDADPYDLDFDIDAQQTAISSILNTSLVVGRDATDQIKFSTDNEIIFRVDGADGVVFKTGGEIEAASLDISGDADIDGTLEADAITVNGTGLTEHVQDIVGAMTSGNTETGIAVQYQDGDGTIDFEVTGNLLDINGLANADGNIIVGNGSAFVAENGNTARTSLGLGTGDSPTFTSVTLSGQANAIAMNNQKITGLATPTDNTDAANKQYVDGLAQGISAKKSVDLKTVGDILSSTASYKPNVQGGADVTLNAQDLSVAATAGYDFRNRTVIIKVDGSGNADNGLLSSGKTDGIQAMRGDRILVDSEGAGNEASHGIYEVLHPGADAGQNPKLEVGFGGGMPSAGEYLQFSLFEGATQTFRVNVIAQGAHDTSFQVDSGMGTHNASISLDLNGSTPQNANHLGSALKALFDAAVAVGSSDFTGYATNVTGNVASLERTASPSKLHDIRIETTMRHTDGSFGNSNAPAIENKPFAPTGGLPYILARAEDSDGQGEDGEFGPGSFTFVTMGTTKADTGWVMDSDGPLVEHQSLVDGARLNFVQFSSAGVVSVQLGLKMQGQQIDLDFGENMSDEVIAVGDKIAFLDVTDGGMHTEEIEDVVALLAGGAGISASGLQLSLDVNNVTTAAAIGHGDSFAFHDIDNTAGTKKSTVLELAQLFAGGSDFDANTTNSQLEIADDAVVLAHLEHGSQGDILSYGGSGAPTRLSKGAEHTVLRAGATEPAYGLLVDANIDNSAAIAISKLAQNQISGKSLGQQLDNLTVDDVTVELNGGNTTYNGSAARTLSVKGGAITHAKLKAINARHIATGALANNELTHAQLTYMTNSQIQNIDNLTANVNGASSQELNRTLCVKVFLNGQLLTPDFNDDNDGDADFDLASADYMFYVNGSDYRIKFNGALVEADDIIVISGLSLE